MKKNSKLYPFFLILVLLLESFHVRGQVFTITDFGAEGDSIFLNTTAIQKTIDACSKAGGGVVRVPFNTGKGSVYVTGTIILKKNVTLTVEKGATLSGSTRYEDYSTIEPFVDGVNATRGACLIGAKDETGIGISGEGTINGQGQLWRKDNNKDYTTRPFLIRFVRSKNILLKDISLVGSAAWMCNLDLCDGVLINHISIKNHVNNANNDGIDIDACKNVVIENCTISSSDDAICFKSTRGENACENITVENNDLQSNCAAIKFGTESMGDFKNFFISNNYIHDTRLCGIKIISADGANNSNIVIKNTSMKNVICPIMLLLESRLKTYHDYPQKTTGSIKNILIDGVVAEESKVTGIFITGIPGQYIGEGIVIQNVMLAGLTGDNSTDTVTTVKEIVNTYPEIRNFGKIPNCAVFVRHAKGITLKNITIHSDGAPLQYAVIADDVKKGTAANLISNFTINKSGIKLSQLKLLNEAEITIADE